MKLRWAFLGVILFVVAGITIASTLASGAIIERAAIGQLEDRLERAAFGLDKLQEFQHSAHGAQARVAGAEPRLKAVLATEEVDHATVLDVAQEMQRALGSDLFLLLDGQGHVLADTANPEVVSGNMSGDPLVVQTLERGQGGGVWTAGGEVFAMRGHRVGFGSRVAGMLVVGYAIDRTLLDAVERQAGARVFVVLDGALVAAPTDSAPEDDGGPAAVAVRAAPASSGAVVRYQTDGGDYLALSVPLTGYQGQRHASYVFTASVDRALSPARSLTNALYTVGGVGLAIAGLLAFVGARVLTRPVEALVALARRVGRGERGERITASGAQELRVLANAMNQMTEELTESRKRLVHHNRLQRELEIAERIQTSMLPTAMQIPGLDIAATMLPADEVGGDYYDVVPVTDGCWLPIGDVAGHGLEAGLIMLMMQSAINALAREAPLATPARIVSRLNDVLYENIRRRLGRDEHATFTLVRYHCDGTLVFAGAHEDLLVYRVATGRCEQIPTSGLWLGARPSVDRETEDSVVRLDPGDVLLLYTDGLVEAMDAQQQRRGDQWLPEAFAAVAEQPPERIVQALLAQVTEFQDEQRDDITLLVARYTGPGTTAPDRNKPQVAGAPDDINDDP